MDNPKAKIGIFLALTLALSAIAWTAIIRAGSISAGGGLYVAWVMWCPGVAAIVTRLITQRNLRGTGWALRSPKLLALAYILPLLYALPVYLIAWGTGLGGFNPSKWTVLPSLTPVTGVLLIATAGIIGSLISALGEEIGWRGLLVPELAKVTSFRNTALISGLIWASWHMPLIFGADYHGTGTPLAFQVLCFVAMIVPTAFILAWIRLKSGSVWPAALLHASHNLFVQAIFDNATADKGSTGWWTGEFGAGLVITISVAAFLILRASPIGEKIAEPATRVDEPAELKTTTA